MQGTILDLGREERLESYICRERELGSIPGLGRSPGEGKGNPLLYSGLENSMDCIVHGVTKSQIQPRDFYFQPLTSSHSNVFPCYRKAYQSHGAHLAIACSPFLLGRANSALTCTSVWSTDISTHFSYYQGRTAKSSIKGALPIFFLIMLRYAGIQSAIWCVFLHHWFTP